jgi:hypothetical protein
MFMNKSVNMDLVECRSDGSYAGRPLVVGWQGERHLVKDVLAEWRSPEGNHFRVITQDEKAFECLYLESEDTWKIKEI